MINAAWEKEQQNTLRQVKMKGAVSLNGDGRCDSPGHNAKYGTYTLMDDNAGKITAFSIVQVSEVTSSNAMEKEGFIRCLTTLEDNEVAINRITTPAHVALEEVVLNRKLLKDLAKLADFCHTGGLEVYHSMLLKYCPKREHFTYQGMLARTQLAALDNNSNVGRQQAVERSGQPRYRPCYPKGTKRWVVKPQRL